MSPIKKLAGDFWGGLAAMLVALPSAIAFGVTIYSPLGAAQAATGAMAGLLGAIALGLVAAALGGAPRLISAPCAPAAAVLTAFTVDAMQRGVETNSILLMLTVLGLLTGLLQIAFGALRLGKLIEYMPYPVVSGYLTGVGLIILGGQLPKLLGTPRGLDVWHALSVPELWNWKSILIGVVAATVMLGAPRVVKLIPAAILGLLAGVGSYFALAWAGQAPLTPTGNPLVIGPLGGGSGGSFFDALSGRWQAVGELDLKAFARLIFPALTLAGLLSIDTLKTCLVLDAMTRSRHNSNRELIGQGLGNLLSAGIGGMPGAGTMGATLVNLSSGGASRFSGIFEGALALLAFVLLGSLIAWVPVGALAAILIVIGIRMFDLRSLHFLRSRSTLLDFAVIATVVAAAVVVGLIAASLTGIILAILLFVREQIGGAVLRRRLLGNLHFSKRVRSQAEMEFLAQRGACTAVCELQGALFFGTTNQLLTALEPDLCVRRYLILDFRRVQTVDLTAAHMLEQVRDILAERNGCLIFTQIPQKLPSGRNIRKYLAEVGLIGNDGAVRVFGEIDEALEWAEDRVIADASIVAASETVFSLHEFDVFSKTRAESLAQLEQRVEKRSVRAGERIFTRGDGGDELFLIRRGAVRIVLPIAESQTHHLGTFGRGSFFGEMAFLDGATRSADAIAFTETELYVLSRRAFDQFADEHSKTALALMEGLASVLSSRLRYTNAELRALEA